MHSESFAVCCSPQARSPPCSQASFAPAPGEVRVSCCSPYLCGCSNSSAARLGERLPGFPASAAPEPGIPLLFLFLAGSSGQGEDSAGHGGAATSGRSGTRGLSCFSQFSTGSVCWVGTDPSSAPSQIFPHSHNVSTSVSAQNASQEMALDCFHAQAKRRDEPCSQRHMEVITGITTTLPSTGCGQAQPVPVPIFILVLIPSPILIPIPVPSTSQNLSLCPSLALSSLSSSFSIAHPHLCPCFHLYPCPYTHPHS